MTAEQLNSILFSIGNKAIIAYFVALIIVVYRFRRINSTVLCIGIVFMSASVMQFIYQPLLDLNSREVWYGTWTLINCLIVYALYKSHNVLKVNLAKLTNTVALFHVVLAFIQITRYMEREYLGGEFLDSWYYITIQTLNISLALVVLITAIKDKKEKMVGMYV